MSLITQAVTDATTVFLADGGWKETFTHAPAGGSATTYCGIINRLEDVDPGVYGDGKTLIKKAAIETANNGTAVTGGPSSVSEGDTIVFDSITWKVEGRPSVAHGWQKIDVVAESQPEFSGPEYRIKR